MGLFDSLTTDQRRETPLLSEVVPAGASDFEVAWQAPADGTLEHMTMWAVPGSEDQLRLRPVIRRYRGDPDDPDGYEDTDIPNYGDGDDYVTGEPSGDKTWTNAEVREGDEIVVIADNQSPDYGYRFRVLPTVDYVGGIRRFLGFFGGGA